ncbi:MAG TPA: glucose-6-phosphate dehydrogenase assembly protein OpcA [Solirubrobacteraceae bacterium]|nr:glucose-6-phosphate dehydrogenase assembly protein OpcA [Solirubrobacteraceae bacterium]
MSEEVWSARGTTPDAIEAALRELLRARHAADEALAPARVLNLVVIVDRQWRGEIANRLERAGRYNASRTVLCAVEEGRTAIDAVATVSDDEQAPGAPRVMRESVVLEIGAGHLAALGTIVDPILVDELPTVVWSPHHHDEALDAMRALMDVVLVDSDDRDDPAEAFDLARRLARAAYVVDLAWLRTTPWRERLAASFDLPARRPQLRRLARLEVRHRGTSAASGLLLVGWLASRLGWATGALEPAGGGLAGVARRPVLPEVGDGDGEPRKPAGSHGPAGSPGHGGPPESVGSPEPAGSHGPGGSPDSVLIALRPVEQEAPGLAGVTVSASGGTSLSLQRGPGGLDACEVTADGTERVWRILGASRGEGGILGEGVRQALLRDPTYEPALGAATALCGARRSGHTGSAGGGSARIGPSRLPFDGGAAGTRGRR